MAFTATVLSVRAPGTLPALFRAEAGASTNISPVTNAISISPCTDDGKLTRLLRLPIRQSLLRFDPATH